MSAPSELSPAEDTGGVAGADLQARCEWLANRLRQVLDSASTAFVATDTAGAVIDWNQEAERLFGWRREEVFGRRLSEIILVEPSGADEAALFSPPRSMGSPLRGSQLRVQGQRRNGDVIPLSLDVWSTPYEGSHTLNAFAYELKADDPGGGVRCEMGSLVDSTGEPIIGTDLNATICTWNPAAEQLFGYTAADVMGAPLAMLFGPRYADLAQALDRLRAQGTVVRHDTVAVRKDRSPVEVSLTLSLVRNGAHVVTGFSAVARDVTNEHRLTAELNDTLHGLEAALHEARHAEEQERSVLATVAHQLKTPIAGIRASADTLLKGVSPSAHERLLAGMVRETSRAARLLTALLQMARLDEGFSVSTAPCDLVALCEEEAARAATLSPELPTRVYVVSGAPEKVELDANAVREIVSNLLDNARRHAGSRIDVMLGVVGPSVEVRVGDDGPGLPDGMADHAFQRFVSLDGRGGSGLGLPIARGLARAHHGDLTYEDGAFVLRLPAQAPPT